MLKFRFHAAAPLVTPPSTTTCSLTSHLQTGRLSHAPPTMISRGTQVPVSLARQRPCQYQCQRHLERQWLPKPPPRRSITTKPLPGDPQTPPNQSISKPLNPRRTRWRRLSNSPPTPTTPSPPDDEFQQWRNSIFSVTPDDEFQQWRDSIFHVTPLPPIGDATSTTPRPDPSTQPAVLDISPLPPSLLDTDFQRLASPGHHVDGWTGGLVKVLPSLHPQTKDHQGQYFLFFDTLLAARSYADNLLNSATTSNPSNPSPLTLLPPSLPRPRIHILSSTYLKSLLRRFYPPPSTAGGAPRPPNLAPRPENLHASVFHPERDDALAARVRVRLIGSRITAATLRAAIARDGRERGLPWGVVEGEEGVAALAGSGAWVERGLFSAGPGVEGGVGRKVRAFDRFVVTFEEAGEARRFVRGWHGREMLDRRNERVMGVEVLGLS